MEEPKAVPFLLFNVVGEEVTIDLNSDVIPLFNSIQDDLVSSLFKTLLSLKGLRHDNCWAPKNGKVVSGK
jgi:hypothetical protein